MSFKLKGTNSDGTGSKTKRTVAQKIEVLSLISGGTKGLDALAEVFGEDRPKSYTDHPHSIIGGFKKSIGKKLAANDAETIELATAAGLIEEVDDIVEEAEAIVDSNDDEAEEGEELPEDEYSDEMADDEAS